MKLYFVRGGKGVHEPELIEVEGVERKRTYSIEDHPDLGYRKVIRKSDLYNLRIGTTPQEAVDMFMTHIRARVTNANEIYCKRLHEYEVACAFEGRFCRKNEKN